MICSQSFRTLLVTATLLSGATLSRAQLTIVSNLAETPDPGGGQPVGSNQWLAEGFAIPAGTAYSLNGVTLKLDNASPFTGTFTVALWDATGPNGTPGTELTKISSGIPVSSLTTSPVDYPFNSNTPISLAPGTSYFVVLEASASLQNAGIYWSYTPSPSSTGPATLIGSTTSVDQGSHWDFLDTSLPQQLAVTATAVPEPAVGALVSALALVAFAGIRRWKRY